MKLVYFQRFWRKLTNFDFYFIYFADLLILFSKRNAFIYLQFSDINCTLKVCKTRLNGNQQIQTV
jgi:hypothetical protein